MKRKNFYPFKRKSFPITICILFIPIENPRRSIPRRPQKTPLFYNIPGRIWYNLPTPISKWWAADWVSASHTHTTTHKEEEEEKRTFCLCCPSLFCVAIDIHCRFCLFFPMHLDDLLLYIFFSVHFFFLQLSSGPGCCIVYRHVEWYRRADKTKIDNAASAETDLVLHLFFYDCQKTLENERD